MPCAPAPLRAPPGLAACGALRADACVGHCAPHARRLPTSPPLLFSSCAAPWPRTRDPRAPCFPPRSSPEAQALRDWQVREGGGETLAFPFLFFPVGTQFQLYIYKKYIYEYIFCLLRGKRARGEAPRPEAKQRPLRHGRGRGRGIAAGHGASQADAAERGNAGERRWGAARAACGGRARTCERQRPCSRAAPRLLARHPPARAQGTQAAVSRLPPTRVAPI